MKRTIKIDPRIALRNIKSSMCAEGFRVSEETMVAYESIMTGRKSAA